MESVETESWVANADSYLYPKITVWDEGKNLGQLTNNPKLWNCRWSGRTLCRPNTGLGTKTVIYNRNYFADMNNLKKSTKVPQIYLSRYGLAYTLFSKKCGALAFRKEWDHIESYEKEDGDFILVSSPYEAEDNFYSLFGFTKIPPLYDTSATTYYKLIKRNPFPFNTTNGTHSDN
jgi:hypothetical protein